MKKTKIKKIAVSALTLSVMFSMGTSSVFASTLGTLGSQILNANTGYLSDNIGRAVISSQFSGQNNNLETISNLAGGSANTGENSAFANTLSGLAETGSIGVAGGLTNTANVNSITHQESFTSSPIAANYTTGACSDNVAFLSLENLMKAENYNRADIKNKIYTKANTGKNIVSKNTGAGGLETGDILGQIKAENTVNANYISLAGGLGGSVQAGNQITGAGSKNIAKAKLENKVSADNSNYADIENKIFSNMNTGKNLVLWNTGNTQISTGDSGALIDVKNQANSNRTNVVSEAGTGQLSATNSTTGAESLNLAMAKKEQSVQVENYNQAGIENDIRAFSNTGMNKSGGNTGSAGIATGDAVNAVNVANGPININETNVEAGGGSGDVSAVNETTGAYSENLAIAKTETLIEAENSNNADIENNVSVASNTGYNSADFNTGTAGVSTGSASSTANVSNGVNSNVTNISSAPLVDVVSGNSQTGAGSENASIAVASNVINVSNTNNAEITNNISSSSNTGGNSSDCNTCGGEVSTGSASLTIGATNTGNSNTVTIGN